MKKLKDIIKKIGDFVEEIIEVSLFSLTIILIIILVFISIVASFITPIVDPDSARYLLSAIIQSQAAIFAIVITVTLVALQLASQTYSPKIFRKFLSKKILRGLYLLFISSMVLNSLILSSITGDASTSGGTLLAREILVIPIALFALSLGYLIFYIDEIGKSLQPLNTDFRQPFITYNLPLL